MFKFTMNNIEYTIKLVQEEDLQKEIGEIDGEYFGVTIPKNQEIWILETLSKEQKRQTLMHELFHCYIFCYLTFNKLNFEEDDYADISANSHDIIDKIVNDYFKNNK